MASFFGEITPLTSRAVDDEESENQPKFTFLVEHKVKVERLTCKVIILSVGETASTFLKCYILSDNAILQSRVKCSVHYEKPYDGSEFYNGIKSSQSLKELEVANIYFVEPDILIGEVSSRMPEELCYELCRFLTECYSPQRSVLLTSSHTTSYKTESHISRVESPFLRCLATSKYLADNICEIPRLEPPNFLTKFPAALLSHYECLQKPAICIILYQDGNRVDLSNLEIFEAVLKLPILLGLKINHNASTKLQQSIQTAQCKQSNLYT